MHKMDLFINHEEKDERGQSLVEFVLVLPIILVMIAGVLEVTNIILVYNNVQQAAREGARYGAGGGVDNGIDEVVLDTITNNLNEDNVESIWVIRPQYSIPSTSPFTVTFVGESGTQPWGTEEVCIYPQACTETTSGLSASQVKSSLQAANQAISDDPGPSTSRDALIEVVADADTQEYLVVVVVNYKAQTILNLSFFDYFGPEGTLPLQAWTIMRQEVLAETLEKFNSGCSAYPIAINLLSLGGPTNTTKLYEASEGDQFEMDLNSPGKTGIKPDEGYGFLKWRGTSILATDLANPSTSATEYEDAFLGPGDTSLHRDNWVWASWDAPPSGVLQDHILAKRALRVIGYYYSDGSITEVNPGDIGNARIYQIDQFVIVKIAGIDASNRITFEFLRMDNSCGYDLDD